MLVVGLLFLLNNYTMGFYIQPEYNLDDDKPLTEQQCEELAHKINDMLSQDKEQEAKELLLSDGLEFSLEDLQLLKETIFGVPSVDEDVDAEEFDWGESPDEDL